MIQADALTITGILWTVFVLVPYALALELRRALDPNKDNQDLYIFTSHVFEWWAVSLGLVAGIALGLLGPAFTFGAVVVGGLIIALCIGGGGFGIASRIGFGADVSGHTSRAFAFFVCCVAVFVLGVYVGANARGVDLFATVPDSWRAAWQIFLAVAAILGFYGLFKPIIKKNDV